MSLEDAPQTTKPENGSDSALKESVLARLGGSASQVPLQSLVLEVLERLDILTQRVETLTQRLDARPHDDKIMTFNQWCDLNDISQSTGREIRASGEGPRFIQLSENRIGVSYRENRRWQEARKKAD
jgi:hypothetical protein